MTWTANEVVFVDEPEGVDPWRQREGKPMDTWVMYRTNGIWNDQQEIDNNPSTEGARPGDIRFVDVNGDGEITAADRVRTEENGMPDLMAGLNLGLTVGQFDLRTQLQGAAQVRHYVFTGSVGEFGNYFQEFAENRWTPDNPDASGPRAYNRTDPYWSQTNDYFWRDAKYLRLKSARLSYELPVEWTDQYGFNQIRAYVSGRNLFTITPLKVMDPEIRSGGAHTYPLETTYTMGLRVAF